MSDPVQTPGPNTPVPRKGRGLKIALALSLALNLAVIGLVGGTILGLRGSNGGEGGNGSPALRSLGLGPFVLALSREDREELRGRIGERGEPLRQDRRAIGNALREVQAALLAEPFDRGVAEAALAQSRDRTSGLQEHGHGALLDQIETMSAQERADLAESLNRVMRRFGGRR